MAGALALAAVVGLGVGLADRPQLALAAGVLPLAGIAAVALVRHPAVCLGVLLGTTILFEDPVSNGIGGYEQLTGWQGEFYRRLPGQVSITDLLLLALVAGAALQWRRHREERPVPRPLLAVSALVAAAIVFGVVVGLGNGGWVVALLNHVRPPVYLAVVPIAAVLVLRSDGATRRVLTVALVLASVKAIEGVVLGVQYAFRGGQDTTPVFYNPATNWALVIVIVGIVAAVLDRGRRVPVALLAVLPLATAALLLSLRRGFWIALAVALLVVLVAAARSNAARAATAAVTTTVLLAAFFVVPLSTLDLARERAATLSPAGVQVSKEDRYRLTERRNVVAALGERPLTGAGFGVPWTASRPMTVEYRGARYYAHAIVLLVWLRMGPLGVLAYLALMGLALVLAFRVAARAADPLHRVAAVAFGAATVGLVAAETTASHTGSNLRHTIVFAALLGVMAAVDRRAAVAQDDARRPGGG